MAQHLKRMMVLMAMSAASVGQCDSVLHDPTLPPASLNAQTADNPNSTDSPVQMITLHGKQRSAIVHGKEVKIGDVIKEGRVVGISDKGLLISTDGQLITMKLYPDVTKRILAIPLIHPPRILDNQR